MQPTHSKQSLLEAQKNFVLFVELGELELATVMLIRVARLAESEEELRELRMMQHLLNDIKKGAKTVC